MWSKCHPRNMSIFVPSISISTSRGSIRYHFRTHKCYLPTYFPILSIYWDISHGCPSVIEEPSRHVPLIYKHFSPIIIATCYHEPTSYIRQVDLENSRGRIIVDEDHKYLSFNLMYTYTHTYYIPSTYRVCKEQGLIIYMHCRTSMSVLRRRIRHNTFSALLCGYCTVLLYICVYVCAPYVYVCTIGPHIWPTFAAEDPVRFASRRRIILDYSPHKGQRIGLIGTYDMYRLFT